MKNLLNTFLSVCLISANYSHAFLGSFESTDGYLGFGSTAIMDQNIAGDYNYPGTDVIEAIGGTYNNPIYGRTGPDVTRYNAGQYGTLLGGAAADIADDSGLFRAITGGRLIADNPSGYVYFNFASIHNYGHAGNGTTDGAQNNLTLRAVNGDLALEYSLDLLDRDNIAVVANAQVWDTQFFICPGLFPSETNNIAGLAWYDSLGNKSFEMGYTGEGYLQYKVGAAGAWTTMTELIDAGGWSRINLSVNTINDTLSFNFTPFDSGTGVLGTQVNLLNNAAIGQNIADTSELLWSLKGGSDKNFFDDFDFNVSVPEPTSGMLIGTLGLFLMLNRKRK